MSDDRPPVDPRLVLSPEPLGYDALDEGERPAPVWRWTANPALG
jgi:hypothetical protein